MSRRKRKRVVHCMVDGDGEVSCCSHGVPDAVATFGN